MPVLRERLAGALHLGLAVSSLALLASSPWLRMYRQLPATADFVNLGHVVLGLAVALLALVYAVHVVLVQRRQFAQAGPAGLLGAAGRELAGLAHGRLPTAEGGGLLALLEALLLLSLLATGLTGTGWLLVQGSDAALAWCDVHVICAQVFAGLLLLHVAAVSLHLLDFVRD